MSKIPANKANSNSIKDLIERFPKANIPTEINENNKAFYNILACSIRNTTGTRFELNHRVVTVSERDYNNQTKHGLFSASAYLADEIHILHDPTMKEKEVKKPKEVKTEE